MRESRIETKLRQKVHAKGGICLKLSPQFFEGIPDRLVILPGGMELVETKSKGGRLTPRQQYVHEQLKKIGHTVRVLNTIEKVEDYLKEKGC